MSGAINKANQRQGSHRKPKYAAYATRGMRMINKLRRMHRTLKRQPENKELRRHLVALASANINSSRSAGVGEFVKQ